MVHPWLLNLGCLINAGPAQPHPELGNRPPNYCGAYANSRVFGAAERAVSVFR